MGMADRTHRSEFELREFIAEQIEVWESEYESHDELTKSKACEVISILETLEGFLDGLDFQEAYERNGKFGRNGYWRSLHEAEPA
jgi:hypothetical protein